jgi:hypothetical protein
VQSVAEELLPELQLLYEENLYNPNMIPDFDAIDLMLQLPESFRG